MALLLFILMLFEIHVISLAYFMPGYILKNTISMEASETIFA
jgi:hypothetical protein